jgi:hypothetical protein
LAVKLDAPTENSSAALRAANWVAKMAVTMELESVEWKAVMTVANSVGMLAA